MKRIFLAILLFLFSASCTYSQEEKFYNLSGRTFSVQEITESPKTIIFLWTTWCPHCRTEFSKLVKSPINEEGVTFFYVNLAESQAKIESYLDSIGANESVKERVILDKKGFFSDKYNVIGIPTYILLMNAKVVDQVNFLNRDIVKKAFNNP